MILIEALYIFFKDFINEFLVLWMIFFIMGLDRDSLIIVHRKSDDIPSFS